eukprot:gene9732-6820_t
MYTQTVDVVALTTAQHFSFYSTAILVREDFALCCLVLLSCFLSFYAFLSLSKGKRSYIIKRAAMGGASTPAPHFKCKGDLYAWLAKETTLLVDGMPSRFTPEANMVIALANVAALCYHTINHYHAPTAALDAVPVNWFGFYILRAPGVLGLGPFQGRPACMSIQVGRGVCGTAVAQKKSLVVKDVHEFPGHIACDAASNSEVVVPIFSPSGTSVVGLIDVDSIACSQFDEEDQKGLEAVAAVLQRHVVFPMTKILEIQPSFDTPAAAEAAPYTLPSYAFGPDKPHPMVSGSALPPAPAPGLMATRLPTKLAAVRIEAGAPQQQQQRAPASVETTQRTVEGWTFYSTLYPRITTESETRVVEQHTGVSVLPEIMYLNHLSITDPTGRTVLRFHIEPIMQSAKRFYESAYYKEHVASAHRIPLSEKWADNPMVRHEAGVDWAWRSDFFGLTLPLQGEEEDAVLVPVQPQDGEDFRINWNLLRNQTIPIVFYQSLPFFEDDLHDCGDVQASLKLRVMHTCFFIRFCYALQVHHPDGSTTGIARELRWFHEFGKVHPQGGFPLMVVEEKLTELSAPARGQVPEEDRDSAAQPFRPSLEEVITAGTVRRSTMYYMQFKSSLTLS